jgi:NADH dehydrogenase
LLNPRFCVSVTASFCGFCGRLVLPIVTRHPVLVVGATGLLGAEICTLLGRHGESVRALVRPDSPRTALLQAAGVELVNGDLRDRESVRAACRGAAIVITTANAVLSRRKGDSLDTVDRDGTLALVEVARSEGVPRFVYTSVSPTLADNNPFVQCKRAVERAVRASGMGWTILQPSAFMEVHAGPLGGWDFAKHRARVLGSGRAPMCYVSLHDVAAIAASAVGDTHGANRDLHVTGPEPLTADQAVQIAEEVTGHPFKVQKAPVAVLKAASALLHPFHPGFSSLLAMAVSMEQGERTDLGGRLQDLGVTPTTFRVYVRRSIGGQSS